MILLAFVTPSKPDCGDELSKWEEAARKLVEQDPELRGKYAPVVLPTRRGEFGPIGYSFLRSTRGDQTDVYVSEDRAREKFEFLLSFSSAIVADLGKVPFSKDPDAKAITLDKYPLHSGAIPAKLSHVYLSRIHSFEGRPFVLVKIINGDKKHVAFVWRNLTENTSTERYGVDPTIPKGEMPDKALDKLRAQWADEVRRRYAKDEVVSVKLREHDLVVLASRRQYGDARSGWDFKGIGSFEQPFLMFHNGPLARPWAYATGSNNDHSYLLDLGKADFDKDPNLALLAINHPHLGYHMEMKDGHVYLMQIRDNAGTHFYVVFQVLAADPKCRYLAFIWRRLPGGKDAPPR
jgi:hypothetical protein